LGRATAELATAHGHRSFEGQTATFVGSGVAAFAAIQTVRGRATGEADTRSYHLANLVEWYRSHSIWHLPFQNAGYFTATHPGNGELVGVSALAATGSEQLAYLATIPFGLLVVLACASIARDLGGDWGTGALAAVAVVAAPVSFSTQANSLATDLAAAAGLLAAVACLLRFRRGADHRWLLFAGVALGLGLGSKYTVFVPVAAVALAALVIHRLRALWLVPGLALFAGPWFIRNAVTTGNPIFPQGVTFGGREVLPAGESPLLALSTTMADHVLNARTEVLGRWAELAARLYGPVLVIAGMGLLVAVLRRPRRAPVLAVAALTAVAVLGYLMTPFTGAGVAGLDFLMGSNLRYALPAILLGTALAAATIPRRAVLALSGIAIAYDGWKIVRGAGFRTDLNVDMAGVALAGIAAIVCLLVALRWPSVQRMVGSRRLAVAGLAVAMLFVASIAAVWSVGRSREVTSLERAVQELDVREVTVLGVEDLRSVLGPDLDVEMRVVSAGGRAGERPFDDDDELDAALPRTPGAVLLLLPDAPAVPRSWHPPRPWKLMERTTQGEIYVRSSRSGPAA
jgi:4-amino-4-deoxy-L-arabinose transferase-like glycosyltransferase